MAYKKAKKWDGKDVSKIDKVTLKIDGVRAFLDYDKETVVSRAGKPLHNFEKYFETVKNDSTLPRPTDVEVFHKSWEDTVSLVRTHNSPNKVLVEHIHSLSPVDSRLLLDTPHLKDGKMSSEAIQELLERVLEQGHEGLVLHLTNGDHVKVKPKENADVRVTGFFEGKGQHEGRLGGFETDFGAVGTGFTTEMREEFWKKRKSLVGKIIEVSFMEWTSKGKFRHPAFVRLRLDKDEESIPEE